MNEWWTPIKNPFEGIIWNPFKPKKKLEFPSLIVGKINFYLNKNLLHQLFSSIDQNYKFTAIQFIAEQSFVTIHLIRMDNDQILSIKRLPWNTYHIIYRDSSILEIKLNASNDILSSKIFWKNKNIWNTRDFSKIN